MENTPGIAVCLTSGLAIFESRLKSVLWTMTSPGFKFSKLDDANRDVSRNKRIDQNVHSFDHDCSESQAPFALRIDIYRLFYHGKRSYLCGGFSFTITRLTLMKILPEGTQKAPGLRQTGLTMSHSLYLLQMAETILYFYTNIRYLIYSQYPAAYGKGQQSSISSRDPTALSQPAVPSY